MRLAKRRSRKQIWVCIAAFLIGFVLCWWFASLLSTPKLPRYVLGKTVWIWKITNVKGGDPERIVEQLTDANVDGIFVKTHDGDRWTSNRELLPPLLQACQEARIRVYAWGFVYGNDPEGEYQRAKDALAMPGIAGYCWDVETELNHKYGSAIHMATKLREYRDVTCPEKGIFYTTFSKIDKQEHIPAAEFAANCDALLTQDYWVTFALSPTAALARMSRVWGEKEAKWRASGDADCCIPIIPIGNAGKADNWRGPKYPALPVPPSEMKEFALACFNPQRESNYYGHSWWAADHMKDRHWAVLRDMPGGLDDQEKRFTSTENSLASLTAGVMAFIRWVFIAWIVVTILFWIALRIEALKQRLLSSPPWWRDLLSAASWPLAINQCFKRSP